MKGDGHWLIGKLTGCICGYNSVAEHLLQFVI